jgi:hypothetical protein
MVPPALLRLLAVRLGQTGGFALPSEKNQPDEFAVFIHATLIHVPATNLYG